MGELYNNFLVTPLLNLMLWLYDAVPGHDLGIAIILFTILVRLALYPFAKQQIKQQKAMQALQPKVDEIRKRLKDNREEQARELMALYQAEKVNPAASCLPLLIQLPIFIALFHVLQDVMAGKNFERLYAFVAQPGSIDPTFLGIVNLANPSYPLAIIAGIVQYFSTKQIMGTAAVKQPPADVKDTAGAQDESMAAIMNKQMLYIMPVMTIVIGFTLPGGLSLYWLTMSLLMWIQQTQLLKLKKAPEPPPVAPVAP
jgi:YidC/Oxa1 family membrane protein insertase